MQTSAKLPRPLRVSANLPGLPESNRRFGPLLRGGVRGTGEQQTTQTARRAVGFVHESGGPHLDDAVSRRGPGPHRNRQAADGTRLARRNDLALVALPFEVSALPLQPSPEHPQRESQEDDDCGADQEDPHAAQLSHSGVPSRAARGARGGDPPAPASSPHPRPSARQIDGETRRRRLAKLVPAGCGNSRVSVPGCPARAGVCCSRRISCLTASLFPR